MIIKKSPKILPRFLMVIIKSIIFVLYGICVAMVLNQDSIRTGVAASINQVIVGAVFALLGIALGFVWILLRNFSPSRLRSMTQHCSEKIARDLVNKETFTMHSATLGLSKNFVTIYNEIIPLSMIYGYGISTETRSGSRGGKQESVAFTIWLTDGRRVDIDPDKNGYYQLYWDFFNENIQPVYFKEECLNRKIKNWQTINDVLAEEFQAHFEKLGEDAFLTPVKVKAFAQRTPTQIPDESIVDEDLYNKITSRNNKKVYLHNNILWLAGILIMIFILVFANDARSTTSRAVNPLQLVMIMIFISVFYMPVLMIIQAKFTVPKYIF